MIYNVNQYQRLVKRIPLFEDIMLMQHYYYQGDGDFNDQICDVIWSHSKFPTRQLSEHNKTVPTVLQGAGLSGLKPNVLLMGFKSDWSRESPHAAHSYVGILQWVGQRRAESDGRASIIPRWPSLPVFQRCVWAAVRCLHSEDQGGLGRLPSISVTSSDHLFIFRENNICHLVFR